MINLTKANDALRTLNSQMQRFQDQIRPDSVTVTLRQVTGEVNNEVNQVVTADASVRVHFHATSSDNGKVTTTLR